VNWPIDPAVSDVIRRFVDGVTLPPVRLVRRVGSAPKLEDLEGATRSEMRRVLAGVMDPAGPIAVGVGSRGIAHLQTIVRCVIDELTDAGFEPFVVPAMGSHGGGTAAGQREMLASLGISTADLGVPIKATMETETLGRVGGIDVHADRHVVAAGQVFLISRVKPHTDFTGPFESGPVKMAAIGLGKQLGARAMHSRGVPGLRDLMPEVGRYVASRLVLGALAIVENADDEIAVVAGLCKDEIGGDAERRLLDQARELLPTLAFDDVDVLIVERIGKDISGTCLDPNVIGRWLVTELDDPPRRVRALVALDLTETSHGNGLGIGLADFVPHRLIDKLDLATTYVNSLTSGWAGLKRSRLPIIVPTDADAVLAAVGLYGVVPARPIRLAWIRDTLHAGELAVSEALWQEVENRPDLEIVGEVFDIPFDADGALRSLETLSRAG
jgi:hypothetical protein